MMVSAVWGVVNAIIQVEDNFEGAMLVKKIFSLKTHLAVIAFRHFADRGLFRGSHKESDFII